MSKKDKKICNSREEQLAYNEKCFAEHKAKIENLALILGKPAISGSDSHIYQRVGCIKTILNEKEELLSEIKNQIRLNNLVVEFSNSI